jgi:hypothetical protein
MGLQGAKLSLEVFGLLFFLVTSGHADCLPHDPTFDQVNQLNCQWQHADPVCKEWFSKNPDTLKYSRNCSSTEQRPSFQSLKDLMSACGSALGKSWNADMDFYKQCDQLVKKQNGIRGPSACKRALAQQAFYPYSSDDDLMNIDSLSLMNRISSLSEAAARDPNYGQKVEQGYQKQMGIKGGPIVIQSGLGGDIQLQAIAALANNQLKKLDVDAQCYNVVAYTRMFCSVVGSVLSPPNMIMAVAAPELMGGRWAASVLGEGPADIEVAAGEVLTKTPTQSPSKLFIQQIERNSAKQVGKPYDAFGPLGEGENGVVSSKPLVCESKFDCVTFVEHVVAESVSSSPDQLLSNLVQIRYAGGKISYIRRNHFTDLDWIPQNTANGVFSDITGRVGGASTQTVTATIDRGQWLKNHGADRIQRDLTTEQKQAIANRLQTAAAQYSPTGVSIDYVPTQALLTDPAVRSRIPSGSVFSIVRDSTSWILGGKRVPIGTVISHQGFIIRKGDELFLRHASSIEKKIVDVPFDAYLQSTLDKPDIVGLNILQPTGLAPAEQANGTILESNSPDSW